ncbi:MAG: N-acetyltransferase, partial [Proteobacteria bacterium]
MQMKLQPYHRSFLPAVHRWRSEKDSQAYNPLLVLPPEELSQHLERDGASLELFRTELTQRRFMIVNGAPVGTVSLQNIAHFMGTAELGYMVGEEFRGRGYAGMGVGLFIDELFSRTELRRITALVHEDNAASCRVLAKLGFAREGLL